MGPIVMLDAIAGDDRSSAIATVLAVNEYGLRECIHQRQDILDLCIGRARETRQGHVGVNYAGCARFQGLGFSNLPWHAQVNDRLNPKTLQIIYCGRVGLSAAVNVLPHLSKIQNTLLCRQPTISRKASPTTNDQNGQDDFSDPHGAFAWFMGHKSPIIYTI